MEIFRGVDYAHAIDPLEQRRRRICRCIIDDNDLRIKRSLAGERLKASKREFSLIVHDDDHADPRGGRARERQSGAAGEECGQSVAATPTKFLLRLIFGVASL
ncbi:hypothetical protein Rmf_16960 [Roseomonas fluvialis]|uniref:Uncharacterized protein n=1 Tax=Roseomonas fluvialis TaxID=1750527 RepID=A0ABM7Y1T2_9PROT|nr:hypothetical protein Rmf_16960 [Roseomonas fluvialis]